MTSKQKIVVIDSTTYYLTYAEKIHKKGIFIVIDGYVYKAYEAGKHINDETDIGVIGEVFAKPLRKANIKYIEQCLKLTEKEILSIPGVGRKCVERINEFLESRYNMSIGSLKTCPDNEK